MVKKVIDKEKAAKQAIKDPRKLRELFDGIGSEEPEIKYGCEKALRAVSEAAPGLLYDDFGFFLKLMDSRNSFLKWGAITTLSNLAVADREDKFKKVFRRYFSGVTGTSMITAANIVGNSWKIARAKPDLADRIAGELLRVEDAVYESKGKPSPECRNVVIGVAIDSFARFYDVLENKKPVEDFIRRQLKNTRKQVAEKAGRFLETSAPGVVLTRGKAVVSGKESL